MAKPNKNTKIKYDKNAMQFLRVLFLASLVSFVLSLIFMFAAPNDSSLDVTAVMAILGLYFGGLLMLICGISYIGGRCYFARLKKYGFIIPESKKLYGEDLNNLPKSNTSLMQVK